jgi:hypothetical protein
MGRKAGDVARCGKKWYTQIRGYMVDQELALYALQDYVRSSYGVIHNVLKVNTIIEVTLKLVAKHLILPQF